MKLQIKNIYGLLLFESEAESIKELLVGAVKGGANLSGADLSDAKGLLPGGVRPLQISGTFHHLIVREAGHITIGCEHHSVEWWEEHYRAVGRRENYSKDQLSEYCKFIALARYWMRLHGCDGEKEGSK